MTERKETLADIVAEIRANNCFLPDDNQSPTSTAGDMKRYADRIEAAAKREGILRDTVSFHCGDCVKFGFDCDAAKMVGNAAKLREVLERLLDYWSRCDVTYPPERRLRDMALSALAAPPRNCDRFATAEDAYKAFSSYCFNRPSEGKCVGCPIVGEGGKSNCFGAWLMAAAQEGGK